MSRNKKVKKEAPNHKFAAVVILHTFCYDEYRNSAVLTTAKNFVEERMKTTMKAKKLLAVMLAGALALSAAGCGGGGTSSTSGTSSTGGASSATETSSEAGESSAETSETTAKSDATLEIWVYGWEKASADKIAEDVTAYEEETGVKVTVTPIANDSYSTKIQATIAGGTNPDLAFVDAGVQSMQLAAKGKLLGLTEYGVDEYKDDFYDSVWDTMVYKDEVYGLRITSNNLALFYNKDLFDAAGLSYPDDTWEWEDLREAAKTLTDTEAGVYGLDLPVYDKNGGYTWNWLPFLWQNGGEFLNEDRTEAVFNSAEGVEALEFWKAMVQDDKSVPLQAAPTGVNRFTSGITAMVIDGPWNLRTFLEDPEFKDSFGVAPLPSKDGERATVVGGEGVVIFSDTEYPQEAYDYLTHLCCSDFTQVFWDNWLTVPPQSAFADYYADDETYGDYIQVFSDQMDYSRTRPFTPSWPQIENALGINLQGYMFDKSDDAQASLDAAAEEVNEILADEAKEYGE